ncbi:hypothetical protein ACFOON_03160 [Novosphingobium piscinae]|uniref:Inner membrane protein n=1 Tax=Novosphingobium piscinae TaxID=1507448 RepID=A0A7X1G2A5_9SPHN|nr:hypothetical protein [Novosphingobium piscinae]MBC2670682.1 hypothetical protein [Novosphingobium piscinae]
MADDYSYRTSASAAAAPRSGVRTRAVIGTAILAFLVGGGAVGYALWQGLVPPTLMPPAAVVAKAEGPAVPVRAPAASPDPAALAARQDALEVRAAALAERLDSLQLMAGAAAGNAARAEALLVALAARRALDRGTALGLLEDQLRLRFGNSQPNAVATVIDAAREPVTLAQLVAGLDDLAPTLTTPPAAAGSWDRLKAELAGLFVIRRASAPTPEPTAILRRARILLEEGRSADAMAEVRRLPGAPGAAAWLAAVRRYDGARRALDVLETAALIEPRGLRDAKGAAVGTTPARAPAEGAATPVPTAPAG